MKILGGTSDSLIIEVGHLPHPYGDSPMVVLVQDGEISVPIQLGSLLTMNPYVDCEPYKGDETPEDVLKAARLGDEYANPNVLTYNGGSRAWIDTLNSIFELVGKK